MNFSLTLPPLANLALAAAAALSGLMAASPAAQAAVTAEEARQLGTTLTRFGAIKGGNKDGSIPDYTGTPIKIPADYKPGSGFYTDPFREDKPLYRIDSKNVDQHADKLSEGQKRLLKTQPSTYYIDVYPTHRTETYTDKVLKATERNLTTCTAQKDYTVLDVACRGGLPFVIPKNGYEVI